MEVTREFLSKTLDAIVEANRTVFSPPEEGYSGGAIGSLLGSLIEMGPENSVYAEIGVFRGGTLFQVAGRNKGRCFGIDNFSLFDEGIENEDV